MHNSVIDLIRLIEKRPAMYLNRNNIICLRSFIDGWYFRDTEKDVKMEVLNHFSEWLKLRNNLNEDFSWDKIIILYSQDDMDALNVFFELFHKFVEESIN